MNKKIPTEFGWDFFLFCGGLFHHLKQQSQPFHFEVHFQVFLQKHLRVAIFENSNTPTAGWENCRATFAIDSRFCRYKESRILSLGDNVFVGQTHEISFNTLNIMQTAG